MCVAVSARAAVADGKWGSRRGPGGGWFRMVQSLLLLVVTSWVPLERDISDQWTGVQSAIQADGWGDRR